MVTLEDGSGPEVVKYAKMVAEVKNLSVRKEIQLRSRRFFVLLWAGKN